jgi:UDP-N-acetylglucosamine--N-acetylmuramyl-(pentapeptide) pyrophosphoryl-undecaprenol N-acetylglucosamine transferase
LCIVGKPVVFIPSPNVAEDHQTKNAMALVEKNAALMLKESDLDGKFEMVFQELFESKEKQEVLSKNISSLALPDATKHIVDEIEKLLK